MGQGFLPGFQYQFDYGHTTAGLSGLPAQVLLSMFVPTVTSAAEQSVRDPANLHPAHT
jgi:hypothetical protein